MHADTQCMDCHLWLGFVSTSHNLWIGYYSSSDSHPAVIVRIYLITNVTEIDKNINNRVKNEHKLLSPSELSIFVQIGCKNEWNSSRNTLVPAERWSFCDLGLGNKLVSSTKCRRNWPSCINQCVVNACHLFAAVLIDNFPFQIFIWIFLPQRQPLCWHQKHDINTFVVLRRRFEVPAICC